MTLSTPQPNTTLNQTRTIDLSDSLPDMTANIIHDSEHYLLPSNIFEDAIFATINELVDDFALNPDKYLKSHHQQQLDHIAEQYLHS